MFDRYTEDARKIIFFARYEASRHGSLVLEPEHLWLGLLRQSKRLIKRHAPLVTVESIQARLLRRGLETARVSMTVELPLSEVTARAIQGATTEADAHGQKHITAEHLLLALLREENSAI